MKYKSCHLIEHGISINVDAIQACCLSRDFNKGMLPVEYKFENSKIDWEHLFFVKKNHRTHQKNGRDLPACEGCYNLREEDWDEEDYISYINFDHWSRCNSNCIYCGVQANKPDAKNSVLAAMKELIKSGKFKNTGEITFQGGEPTVLKEFGDLLNLFLKQGSKVRIHSSGILFNRAIREGLKQGKVTVVISPDAGSREIYKTIKRTDKFNKVWDNIKHYAKGLKDGNEYAVKVKYIIIPGVNDTFEEVSAFLDTVKKFGIKSVITDVEYTYANTCAQNISPHVYILRDYIENFCNENGIMFDLYDSAKYADLKREHPKREDFDPKNLKRDIDNFRNENEDKNIKYN